MKIVLDFHRFNYHFSMFLSTTLIQMRLILNSQKVKFSLKCYCKGYLIHILSYLFYRWFAFHHGVDGYAWNACTYRHFSGFTVSQRSLWTSSLHYFRTIRHWNWMWCQCFYSKSMVDDITYVFKRYASTSRDFFRTE